MIKVLANTDIGRVREINQDCYYISMEEDDIKLYVVADGMGGYSGGEVASNLAVLTVTKYLNEKLKIQDVFNSDDNVIIKFLKEAFKVAHFAIYEKAQKEKELEEMGTTLDVCLIYNNKIFIAHLGDSRVYKVNIENEEVEQLTIDHSYVQKLVKEGTITLEEAYSHPKKNMLMKALGGKDEFEPDVLIKNINNNEVILMCTDGLTNMLKDKEILDIICTDVNLANKNLIQAANKKGGLDNVTVVLINTKVLGDER